MSAPVLVKLTQLDGEDVTVNMARVLFINGDEDGSDLHMNIPETVLRVTETPDEIRHLTDKKLEK